MSRVLITGGGGFIGASLAQALATGGHEVRCLDTVFGNDASGPVEALRGDVLDEPLVDRLIAEADLVVHLAAVVGVDACSSEPDRILDVNVLGSRNVLRACARHGRPVLLASTSEVYGKNDAPLDEDGDLVLGAASNRRWSYAVSKLTASHYAYALAERGLSFAIVRYFNVYGPAVDRPGEGRTVSTFLGCIRDGRPLPLVDGGAAVRSFCYVSDAVEATRRLALALAAGEAAVVGRAFNIGRDEPTTVRELAERMITLSGRAVGLEEVTGRDFFGCGFEDIRRQVPDVSALAAAVGFTARVGLDEGLRATLAHWGLLRPDEPAEAAPPTPAPIVPMVRPLIEPDRTLLETYRATLASGHLTNDGPLACAFERRAAAWLGAPDAVAVSSGFDALHLTAFALGVRGCVVLPAFTYIATVAAFVHRGLEPVFCDVDPETWTLDPAEVERILAARTDVGAVVPVNVYGVPPDLVRVAAACKRAGATLIYDNAHGFGTERAGRRVPGEPLAQVFSLHATKNVPAIEGGLVLSPDAALLAEVRRLRGHGIVRAHPGESTPGFNARLDELRAATGLHSLARLDGALARRHAYAARLRRALVSVPGAAWRVQRVPGDTRSSFQNLGAVFEPAARGAVSIDDVIAAFREEGVEARRYFHPALHRLPPYRGRFTLPVTERITAGLVCLPLHARMSDADLSRVERSVAEVARRLAGITPVRLRSGVNAPNAPKVATSDANGAVPRRGADA